MFTWKKVKKYAKIRGFNEYLQEIMKQYLQKNTENSQKRLVYQQKSSNENISQKTDDNLAKVSETVKESYGARLELKRDLDDLLQPIAKERELYSKLVEELKKQLALNPSQKEVQGSFDCLGEKVTVTMSANGEYQEFVNQKPINFLSWAIETKKHQKETPNE